MANTSYSGFICSRYNSRKVHSLNSGQESCIFKKKIRMHVYVQNGVASFFHLLGSHVSLMIHPVFPSTVSGRAEFIHKISPTKFSPVSPPEFTNVYKQAALWIVLPGQSWTVTLLNAEHWERRVLFQLGEEQSPGMRLIDSDQMGGHT